MKVLAIFGGAGITTAALVGGSAAVVIGNLAVMAAVVALLVGTVNL